MVEVESVDYRNKTVTYDDGTTITHKQFLDRFTRFWHQRIVGETLDPSSIEHFMRRSSGKNLKMLMDGKKMEGYMEGVADKLLTPRQKIAVGVIVTFIIVGVMVLIILRNQGMIPV